LPHVGALSLLQLRPGVVTQLLHAVGELSNVASQAMQLLIQLLKGVIDDHVLRLTTASTTATSAAASSTTAAAGTTAAASTSAPASTAELRAQAAAAARHFWAGPLAVALTSSNGHARRLVADLFLSEVYKLDPLCVPGLLLELRALPSTATTAEVSCLTYTLLVCELYAACCTNGSVLDFVVQEVRTPKHCSEPYGCHHLACCITM
jgi:hypothetical protein